MQAKVCKSKSFPIALPFLSGIFVFNRPLIVVVMM